MEILAKVLSQKGGRMIETKKLNGLVLVDKKKLVQMLDELKVKEKAKWHLCNICGDPYMETELINDEDIGYICEGCAKAKQELDDEQEETATMIREEKKSKALP